MHLHVASDRGEGRHDHRDGPGGQDGSFDRLAFELDSFQDFPVGYLSTQKIEGKSAKSAPCQSVKAGIVQGLVRHPGSGHENQIFAIMRGPRLRRF